MLLLGASSVPALSQKPALANSNPNKYKPVSDPMPKYGAWHSCRIGGGGYVQNIVLCPSNRHVAYAYVDVGGAYRSNDDGLHWYMINGSLPARLSCYEVRSLSVDPRNDRNILMAVGSQWSAPEGVFSSSNGGKTWRNVLVAPFFGNGPMRDAGVLLTRQPGNPNIVLAASVNAGVYRSTNNGATWANCGLPGLFPTSISFDVKQPTRAYLCASPMTAWFDGGNKTWPGSFFSSENSGKTWSKLSADTPSETVQQADGALIGIFNGTAVRESLDHGVTWANYGQGLPLDPTDKNGSISDTHTSAIASGPGFSVLSTTAGTFYRRSPDRSRWTKIGKAGNNIIRGNWWGARNTGGWSHVGAAVGSVIIDPFNPAHWYFTDWYAAYQSVDSGLHWKPCIDGIESTVIHTVVEDPNIPDVVHLGMADNGYFRSNDGGQTFSQITLGTPDNMKDISVSPVTPNLLYAVGPSGYDWRANQVYVSHDNGNTWSKSSMTGLPDMSLYNCNSITTDPANTSKVYITVSGPVAPDKGGPYSSTDGGDTWSWIGSGLPKSDGFFRSDIFGGVGREIAVAKDGSSVIISHDSQQMWRSAAGSSIWQQCTLKLIGQPGSIVADPFSINRFFVAVHGDGVYRSNDAGENWTKVYNGDAAYVTEDSRHQGRLAVSTGDGIAYSPDNGSVWTQLDNNLPARVDCPICFVGNRLIAGTAGSGAFWINLPVSTKRR